MATAGGDAHGNTENAVQKAAPVCLPPPFSLLCAPWLKPLVSFTQGAMDRALAAKIASFEGSAASDKEEQKILSITHPTLRAPSFFSKLQRCSWGCATDAPCLELGS